MADQYEPLIPFGQDLPPPPPLSTPAENFSVVPVPLSPNSQVVTDLRSAIKTTSPIAASAAPTTVNTKKSAAFDNDDNEKEKKPPRSKKIGYTRTATFIIKVNSVIMVIGSLLMSIGIGGMLVGWRF